MPQHHKTAYATLVALLSTCIFIYAQWFPGAELMTEWSAFRTSLAPNVTVDNSLRSCDHSYKVELLSIDPLIIYLDGFLKDQEIDYILNYTKDEFADSVVYDKDFKSVVDRRYRTSQSAMMPHDDHMSQCLAKRMKSFLGNVQHIETEPIQVVKYEGGEKFSLHTDWLDEPINSTYSKKYPDRYYNRLGSIFAYLDGGCTGGETYFPLVKGVSAAADGDKFSRTETGEGLLIRPRRGSAVFWNNLHPRNASGDRRVLHAGIPVETGRKIGINLFSYYFLDAPFIGGEEE